MQAWRLFAIFVGAIFSVVVSALPILTASVLAVAVAVLTGRSRREAYAGFANGTILLIVVAFLVARAVVQVRARRSASATGRQPSSAGRRSASSYSIFLVDARDRAGVSEQHRALRRALSAGVLAGRGGRRHGRASRAGGGSARS